jgi:outer membrane protein OmpA-like peptidoglycan-associated protein
MDVTQLLKIDLVRSVGAGIVATTLVACGASVTPQLADARKAYEEAEDSAAPTRAPGLLAEARVSLDRAERAHDDQPGSASEKTLAERAERKARHAKAHAENHDDDRYADEHDRALSNEPVATARDVRANEHDRALSAEPVATSRDVRADEHVTREERIAAEKRDAANRPRNDRDAAAALQNLAKVATVKEERRGVVITLTDSSLFAARGEQMSANARDNLNQVADALKQQPSDATFHVRGYTDSTGPDAENQKLSTKRAQTVAERLEQSGIQPSRIRVEGRGEADPIATNDSEEGRAANRRVEIIVDHQD